MSNTILIIEDEEEISVLIKTFLEKHFSNIIVAENGKMAIEILESVTPDLILTDLRMPHVSGFDFLKQLRTQGKNTPVVVISSSQDKQDVVKAMKLGVVDFLEKPFRKRDLENCVYRAIEMSVRSNSLYELVQKFGQDSKEVLKAKRLMGLLQVLNSEGTKYS